MAWSTEGREPRSDRRRRSRPATQPTRGVDVRVLSSPTGSPRRGVRPGLGVLAILVGGIGLAAALALTQSPRPVPPPEHTPGSAGPTDAASPYDADGIPGGLRGEPVLRGAAIAARAASGDPAPFTVAGWQTEDPTPTCPPTTVRCGSTSLVDAPGSPATGAVTLDWPTGAQFSFNWERQWAGGFYVLRVRAACTYGASVCLVVDEEIGPLGAMPTDSDGFGTDGLPLTVDGQPVARGPEVATGLRLDWDRQPRWVAGRVEAVASVDHLCPDPVTWDAHPCPTIRLADPDLGVPFTSAAPTLEGRWGLQDAWDAGATWPGGYVVLRAKAQAVLGYVLPPDVTPAPTPAPMPSLDFSGWASRERVIEIEAQPVRWGELITAYLSSVQQEAFLVTGTVERRACAGCLGGATTVLLEPPVKGADVHGTAFPLLRADGTTFTPGSRMVWADPAGVVVLEVRRYVGTCPPGVSCAEALEVARVAVPPNP